jgi:hypothetical protein
MALAVAISKIRLTERAKNSFAPVTSSLKAALDGHPSESDIALVRYCYDHLEAEEK